MNEKTIPIPNCPDSIRVTDSVPMAHVADVDFSVQFYSLLGFACENRFSTVKGVTNWAAMTSGRARLFLSRASEPLISSQQAVLFYMYSKDVAMLREHLLANGLSDAEMTIRKEMSSTQPIYTRKRILLSRISLS